MNDNERKISLALAVSAIRNIQRADMTLNPQQQGAISAVAYVLARMEGFYGLDELADPQQIAVYFGRPYLIPSWARWLATDEDGTLYAFSDRPRYCSETEVWEPDGCERYACVCTNRDDLPAESSLLEVPQ